MRYDTRREGQRDYVLPETSGGRIHIRVAGDTAEAALDAFLEGWKSRGLAGEPVEIPPAEVDAAMLRDQILGTELDLRDAQGNDEIARRVEEFLAPPRERNEYSGWGDKRLEDEIHRTVAHSSQEWPHHREHSLKAVDRMRAEMHVRRDERRRDSAPAP